MAEDIPTVVVEKIIAAMEEHIAMLEADKRRLLEERDYERAGYCRDEAFACYKAKNFVSDLFLSIEATQC